jgi:predicted alpha/beta hydrolase
VDRVPLDALEPYAHICGWTLARAHARSGDRVAIASYLGKSDAFDRAVADYAAAYADVAEHDHGALVRAVGDGRLPVSDG